MPGVLRGCPLREWKGPRCRAASVLGGLGRLWTQVGPRLGGDGCPRCGTESRARCLFSVITARIRVVRSLVLSHPSLAPSSREHWPGEPSSTGLEKLNESLWPPSQGHVHPLNLSLFYCQGLRILFSGRIRHRGCGGDPIL